MARKRWVCDRAMPSEYRVMESVGESAKVLEATGGYGAGNRAAFDWGRECPGASHLSHAILRSVCGWKIADHLASEFARDVVAGARGEYVVISIEQVQDWLVQWITRGIVDGTFVILDPRPDWDEVDRTDEEGGAR